MTPRAAAPAAALATLELLAAACAAPVVERRVWASAEGAFEKVAIVPFLPWPIQARAGQAIGGPPARAPEQVALMLSEELEALGVEVVRADAVGPTVVGEQDGTGPFDAAAIARAAARRFGATSVVIGRVVRYRERSGEAMGTLEPASVAFEVTAYDPQGRPLRAASFDETQKSMSENLWNVGRYPGGGTRWLTADELTRWGAGAAAEALTAP